MQISGALVTGGASGLGRATVDSLVARGCKVAVLDLPGEKLDAVAEVHGGSVLAVPADVTDDAAVESGVTTAAEWLGSVQLGVLCAGIVLGARTVGRDGGAHPMGMFRKVLDINVSGTFHVASLLASVMSGNEPDEDGQRGCLVMTASVAAFDGQIGQAAYSASKGAIAAMTLPIARDLSAIGVRVCTIAPGVVETPIYDQLAPEVLQALATQQLFPKRLGRPAEYAALVNHIADNAFLNGEVIRLDAGTRLPPK
ncbi:MAG: SDR family NAD(P)-dependent oxidoreductase [Actinomycetales bacterium]|nr:SDR family NAD(P)-dependent oxidoreductase [Actinomycetales bacterium]